MQIVREIKKGKRFTGVKDVATYLNEFKNEDREHFIVIGLDNQNYPIYREIVSIGTLDSALVHPREVFRKAIMMSTKSIIIAHNHPSGTTKASPQDIETTKKLKAAGELLNIPVIDSIIIGDETVSII
jgi:DNA repair protein RadC